METKRVDLDAIRQRDGDYCSACADGTCSLARDGLHRGVSIAEEDRHVLLEHVAELEEDNEDLQLQIEKVARDVYELKQERDRLRAAVQAVVENKQSWRELFYMIDKEPVDALAAELEGSTERK